MAMMRVHGSRSLPKMATGFDMISLDGGSLRLRQLREKTRADQIAFEAKQTERLDRIVTMALTAVAQTKYHTR